VCGTVASGATGTCTNVDFDPSNCGTCGHSCGNGEQCVGGTCAQTCYGSEISGCGVPLQPDGGLECSFCGSGYVACGDQCANTG
jgi:hypothetical protein